MTDDEREDEVFMAAKLARAANSLPARLSWDNPDFTAFQKLMGARVEERGGAQVMQAWTHDGLVIIENTGNSGEGT